MSDEKPQRKITAEEAESILPDGDTVHTFRQDGAVIVGTDWPKKRILERFQTHGVELSGDNARKMNHGLASHDEAYGWLFIETRREAREEKSP